MGFEPTTLRDLCYDPNDALLANGFSVDQRL